MSDFTINISEVEELQMTNSRIELEQMFAKAHRTIVQGEAVILLRKNPDGSMYKFDELTTEPDLATLKEAIFRYL